MIYFKGKKKCNIFICLICAVIWFVAAKIIGYVIYKTSIFEFQDIILGEGLFLILEGILISIGIDFLSIPGEIDENGNIKTLSKKKAIIKRHIDVAFNIKTLVMAGIMCIGFTLI
ncbi:MAG: hypothetical protein RSA01_08270 [Clostridium sp.]|uniref:hypothetical protein n=1 Tax=Clostridium sp. TaxID=1506 RepID=UPI002FCAD377